MKMPANVVERKVLVARRNFELKNKDCSPIPTMRGDENSRAQLLKKTEERTISYHQEELENKPTRIWEQENECQEDFVQLLIEKAVRIAEENAFMRKQIIKLREETREEEDNNHEDLNDKEDLFEILIAEMEKKYEKERNPSSDVDLLQTETRPSSPPLKTIPTRHPDDELLLADSDDENYSSGTDESLDERESL